jgi:ABC-type transporter Mla MlaB component
MSLLKGENNGQGKLVLEGELTLGCIRKLRDELSRSLEEVQHLDIEVAGVVETDLSFLQLMCSAHRTAVKMGKTVALIGDIPQAFQQAVEDNGYNRQSGCGLDVDKTCLWAEK